MSKAGWLTDPQKAESPGTAEPRLSHSRASDGGVLGSTASLLPRQPVRRY